MKRIIAIVIALAGLASIGLLLWRQPQRLSEVPAATPGQTKVASPMDAFQSGIRLDPRTGTVSDAGAKRRLLERLEREEKKQRPAEGRN